MAVWRRASIGRLDYPADRLDVIVVDDGSADRAAVARVVGRHGARLLTNDRNRGPSHSRNRAAREAKSDVLAFVDSDCVPDRSWLRDLTPYFAWDRVAAVGGRTVGYYTESRLDRYEEVGSPLDMGRHLMLKAQGPDTFYVPTCNLLVRRSTYEAVGGLREDLHVGEDVDLCWRFRATGAYLVYAPEGIVRHKHRDRLGPCCAAAPSTGTSEAVLHNLIPTSASVSRSTRRRSATVALVSTALVRLEPRLLPLLPGARPLGWGPSGSRLRRTGVEIPESRHLDCGPPRSPLHALLRLLPSDALLPGSADGRRRRQPGSVGLEAAAVLYAAGVDYSTKRPRMPFPEYLAYYVAEHAAYQAGVAAGCVRARSFRSYLPVFERQTALGARAKERTTRSVSPVGLGS